jgi:hypothetical protein
MNTRVHLQSAQQTRRWLATVLQTGTAPVAGSEALLTHKLIQPTPAHPARDYQLTWKGFEFISGFYVLDGINRHFGVKPCIWIMNEDSHEWATRYIIRAYELGVINDFDLWKLANDTLLEPVMSAVCKRLGCKLWSGFPRQKIETVDHAEPLIERWAAETLTRWKEEFSSMRYAGLDVDPVAAAEKTVAQHRAAVEHILAAGLEIGSLWSERIPVDFRADETHGWVFVSRAAANRGHRYPAADAIYREAARLQQQTAGGPA